MPDFAAMQREIGQFLEQGGPLTPKERAWLKAHTDAAQERIADVKSFADYVMQKSK